MKRWNTKQNEEVENMIIDAFLTEIQSVCQKHGLSLRHEDTQGAFEVWPYNEHDMKWLLDAVDCTGEEEPSHGLIIQCGGKYWQLTALVLKDPVNYGDPIRIEADGDQARVFVNDKYINLNLKEVSKRKADIILAEGQMVTGRISNDLGIEVREEEQR